MTTSQTSPPCYLMSDRLPEGASLLEKYKVGEAARAEAQSSESYEVLYNYGTMLIYSDRLEEAREVLQRALRCGRLELRDGEELAVDAEEESGEEPEPGPHPRAAGVHRGAARRARGGGAAAAGGAVAQREQPHPEHHRRQQPRCAARRRRGGRGPQEVALVARAEA